MMLGSGLWMEFGWLWMLGWIALPVAAVALAAVAVARSTLSRKES